MPYRENAKPAARDPLDRRNRPQADRPEPPAARSGLAEASGIFIAKPRQGQTEGQAERQPERQPVVHIAGRIGDLVGARPGGPRPIQPTIGLRLNRIGGAEPVVPDLAAIPRSLRDRGVKRALDLVFAGIALAVLAPLMAVVAALLKAQGGPVFFSQTRVGHGRTRFACLKFRSMRPGAEGRLRALLASDPAARAEWRVHQKLARDPRITRLGRFLRATSLDELPQLVNVLRGEMSLVGPRPIIAPEVPGYPADRAYYESESFADYAGCVPGITGLWQISGRHRTGHDDRIRLDRWYARNWSVLLDLIILRRTIAVVLAGSGR